MFRTIIRLLAQNNLPPVQNLGLAHDVDLPAEGLTMGTVIAGKQGSGKTSWLAGHLVNYMKAYPDRAIFVLDPSGSLTGMILKLIAQEPFQSREMLLRRTVYDELGNPERVVPMPEFSPLYETNVDEQISRVVTNWAVWAEHLVKINPTIGGQAIKGLAPHLLKFLNLLGDEWSTWQVTEFGSLVDNPAYLKALLQRHAAKIPARLYEALMFRVANVGKKEEELRTYAFTELTGTIESPAGLARLGADRPGYTPHQAINNGQLVLINGQRLINQKNALYYDFIQTFSLIMEELNRRQPADPNDSPVSIVMDEVYALFEIPGMAEFIGKLPSLYRSRKVQPYIVIQALWQLDDKLREQIWSFGNRVIFGTDNFDDAVVYDRHHLHYDPRMVKQDPRTDAQNPTTEPVQGQQTMGANWIQSFVDRQCFVQRYLTEQHKDPHILYMERTPDLPTGPVEESVEAIKQRLLQRWGIPIGDVREMVRRRTAPPAPQGPPHI